MLNFIGCTVITYFVADYKQYFITSTKAHLKANRNSDTDREQAPSPLEMGSYFLLMWPKKMRTHEFPSPVLRDDNRQACKSLAHTRAQLPKNRSGRAWWTNLPHPPGPTERVWLGSNPRLRQWRLPGMMDDLEDLKPPFAFSQINN